MGVKKSTQSTNIESRLQGSFFYEPARLVLQDGTVFECQAFGQTEPIETGEVVFHTGMSGYQEILTDPSYAGQVVTFTYPHIGNYGINLDDNESSKIHAQGVILRDYVDDYSNYRAHKSLHELLKEQDRMGLTSLDTRKLTRIIREQGAMPAAFGTAPVKELKKAATAASGTDGHDLARSVSTTKQYTLGKGARTIVAFDFGIKQSILNNLAEIGKVIVVPADTTANEVLKLKPDGVFLSNGPGDPGAVDGVPENIKALIGEVPIFGICLGHQLLSRALGAKTRKLKFGHHGGNHPVIDERTKQVMITSQNYNYSVVASSVKDAEITHRNLNDNVVEGVALPDKHAFSVQFHPEAGPGPHDGKYLFEVFKNMMDDYAKTN